MSALEELRSDEPTVVISGVSGSGKSTIGALIARELGVPFVDADSLHPVANIEKMAAGHPLDDDDRWPWLAIVGRNLAEAGTGGLVIACSALKRVYRDAIRRESPGLLFVQLDGSRQVLGGRLEGRTGHFMPPALLDSQLAALEPLGIDERGAAVDIDAPVSSVVDAAVNAVRSLASGQAEVSLHGSPA